MDIILGKINIRLNEFIIETHRENNLLNMKIANYLERIGGELNTPKYVAEFWDIV